MNKKWVKKLGIIAVVLSLAIGVTVQAANCVKYTVQPGDSLWKIAKNFQVDFTEVLDYNTHFEDQDLIYPGDIVYVPVDIIEKERPKRESSENKTNSNESGGNTAGNSSVSETEKEIDQPAETELKENDNIIAEETQGNSQGGTEAGTDTPIQETNGNAGSENQGNTNNNGNTGNNGNTDNNAEGLADLESQVFALVNEERINAGLSPLALNTEVRNTARVKSQDMINNGYFAHESPTYGSPFEMLTTFGVSYSAAGENIAYGQKTAEEVMNTWMNSPGHRANILSGTFTQIGIGCVKSSNGTLYWTQMFIKP